MKVTELDAAYYQVEHRGRWWTVAVRNGPWLICNETGRRIAPEGRVGLILVGAVMKHLESQ